MTQTIASKGRAAATKHGEALPPIVDLDGADAGGPVFAGTDVPLQRLFAYLDEAHNLHAFLRDFPQVSRAQALEAVRARVKADGVVHSNRQIVSGTPVFKGTRVPLDILFEFLAAGENIDEFVDCFPTVSREQAVAALTAAQRALESVAYETAS